MPAAAPATDPRLATSLVHGLRLLQAFAEADAGRSNGALAAASGLSRPTVSRLTTTLAARGLVVTDAATRRYRLGSTALTLGYPLLAELGVRWLARLPMKQLADAVGGAVSLGLRDRDRLVLVETSRGSHALASRPDLGATLPMLRTAMGRAWLAAAWPPDASGPPGWREAAAQGRAELRRHGFCTSRGELRADVHAVAVPLAATFDGAPLALNCSLPAAALAPDQLRQRIGPALRALAQRIDADWQQAAAQVRPPLPGRAARYEEPFAEAAGARHADDRQFAHTLARGIDLMLCLQPGDGAVGNRELARRLQLLPSTVARLTHTLCAHGWLRRDPDTARYRLGPAALTLAYPMVAGVRLRQLARPAMTALAQEVGGAVSLGLRHQLDMVYLETAWRTDERLVPPDIGAPMPMLASAMGRAWLARAAPAERAAVLNRLRLHDAAGFDRYSGAVQEAQAAVAQRGYCWSRAARPQIQAVAVPFAQPVDGLAFVMNCGVFAPQPLPAARARAIAGALVEVVRGLERSQQEGPGSWL